MDLSDPISPHLEREKIPPKYVQLIVEGEFFLLRNHRI